MVGIDCTSYTFIKKLQEPLCLLPLNLLQTQLRSTIPVKQFAASPGLGNLTFQMKARSSGGLTVRTETGATIQNGVIDTSRVGKFSNIGDEPAGLLGTDTGMSPTEYIMQALAGCYTATLTMMAAEKGSTSTVSSWILISISTSTASLGWTATCVKVRNLFASMFTLRARPPVARS